MRDKQLEAILAKIAEAIAPKVQATPRLDAKVGWIKHFIKTTVMDSERHVFNGERLDSATTAVLAHELEHMLTEVFSIEYPELLSRKFFETDSSIGEGAETVAYRQYDRTGKAIIAANTSTKIPMVNVSQKKFDSPIVSLVAGYEIGFQQLRAAAMARVPLQDLNIEAARESIDYGIDYMAAFGDAESNIKGILNHASIPGISPDTGTHSTATAQQMIGDLSKLVSSIATATKDTRFADTLLLPTALHTLYSITPINAASDTSVLNWIKANIPGIKTVEKWAHLDLANTAGTGKRILAYASGRRNARIIIPMEFMMHAPQPVGLAFEVPCEARCGGVLVPYPKAFAYMDGC